MDESAIPLPGRCTDIVAQKKQKDRVSLFVEGIYLDGFHRDVIYRAGIIKGDLITEELLRELVRSERQYLLHNQICRWLAIRNHSSREIYDKSLARGYTLDETREALEPFIERGYQDDALFAETFSREKKEINGWGPAKIRNALAQKGVKKQYIDTALEIIFTDQQLINAIETAAKSACKRLMRTEPGLKRKSKLVNFLIRRGFPGYLVMEKCDELLKKLGNEEL